MKQIKGETKGLVELELLAIPEKSATAGLCGTNGRGGGHSSSIEEGFRGTGEIEENLLAKKLRPDRLVALEAIAIERIVPMRFCIDGFAGKRVAAIVRLRENPAIGNGRENFRAAEVRLALVRGCSLDRNRDGDETRDTNRLSRQTPREVAGRVRAVEAGATATQLSRGDQENFQREDFIRIESDRHDLQRRVPIGFDAGLIGSWNQQQNAKCTVSGSERGDYISGGEFAQLDFGCRDGASR